MCALVMSAKHLPEERKYWVIVDTTSIVNMQRALNEYIVDVTVDAKNTSSKKTINKIHFTRSTVSFLVDIQFPIVCI